MAQVGIDDTDSEIVVVAVGTDKNIYHLDDDGQPLCSTEPDATRRVAIETIPWHIPCTMCASASTFECTVDGCPRTFDTKQGRGIHESQGTHGPEELRYKGDPEGDGRIYRCVEGDCGKQFLDRTARDGHLQSHGGPSPDSFVPKGSG